MSRKCPKRNYIFLNWLKENRHRFVHPPYVLRCRNRMIDFHLRGTSPVLRFRIEFLDGNRPWLSVDVIWKGQDWDGLVRFYGAEILTDKGWTSRSALPEYQKYWDTKEELWIEWCFERFLAWCNENLTSHSWLEIYEIYDMPNARLHKGVPKIQTTESVILKIAK